MIKVEYLVAINFKSGRCQDIESLKCLLKSNSRVDFNDKKIVFDTKEFKFNITEGEIEKDVLKFYHLIIESKKSELEDLNSLCREIRSILSGVSENKRIQVLWDGIGFELCQQAYPKIYEVENTLRKLITKFMLSKVGLSWHKQSLPNEVKESIRNEGEKESNNCLYEADFIQLSNFLFKQYAKKDLGSLLKDIESEPEGKKFGKKDLETYIPKSNWERYFKDLVSAEQTFIEKRWQRLYDLRCKVAHNKSLSSPELEEIATLVEDLMPKLEEALQKLDTVTVPEEEKEQVAESVAKFRNPSYGLFLQEFETLNKRMLELQRIRLPDHTFKMSKSFFDVSKVLETQKIINEQISKSYKDLASARNTIVHNYNATIPEELLLNKLNNIELLTNKINTEIDRPEKSIKEDSPEDQETTDE